MTLSTAHLDTFARDHLPPPDLWPELTSTLPELQFPDRLNAAVLLDRVIETGRGDSLAVVKGDERWSYRELHAAANRLAHLLVEDLGLVPGNRVLLHAANSPWMIAAWFAILKAGGVAVTTMPLLRSAELAAVADAAQITHAIADPELQGAVRGAAETTPLRRFAWLDAELKARLDERPAVFANVPTACDDPAIIAFTSGTTGRPKGCVHFHRDILAMAETFSRHVLRPSPDDVFCGTPPLAFTFGLGGGLVFPIHVGAAISIPPEPGYERLRQTIARDRVTTLFTAPTAYRALLKLGAAGDLSTLARCVSAGEPLPAATSDAWLEATGVRIIDGIGSTEMIHIFISSPPEDARPGATGKPVPGYQACVLGPDDQPLPPGSAGRLAVKGPTGCRYLADERQRNYVCAGWNVTGDIYRQDEDGYFWFVSRADDMIISAGYNIGACEVEQALMQHPAVLECAVVGTPDPERGQIVHAFVVLNEAHPAGEESKKALQDHVKATIAPYKYPRAVTFVTQLPKTATGKLQRYRLRTEGG